jgi:serine/threonine protein kinase
MDLVDGQDAARLLADRFPAGMPVEQVALIVTAVASALDYAHKQGLLHCDVKSANIMLSHLDDDGEQRILLADFGIARDIEDISGLTTTNMTVGTVAYAAPEQLMGEDITVTTPPPSPAGATASVLTDNGAIFTATRRGGRTLQVLLGELSITYINSRPYTPQTCGKVERIPIVAEQVHVCHRGRHPRRHPLISAGHRRDRRGC